MLALLGLLATALTAQPALTLRPAGALGVDVLLGDRVVAPLRLSSNGLLSAGSVTAVPGGWRLSALRCTDPAAVAFDPASFVEVTQPDANEPRLRFELRLSRFGSDRWLALCGERPAPFHFLTCALPTAQVWHQRGWLNATPNVDRFPLLTDKHAGSPEIGCTWNRNWSYLCPLSGHPIPMIGAWDPARRLYVGYDFQESRAGDQRERDVATGYCWQQGADQSFFTLAYPHGGLKYGQLVWPRGDETVAGVCRLIVDPDLPAWEDPNERFQARLFARWRDQLPTVPDRCDLSWIAGGAHLKDFLGPGDGRVFGPGGEATFYPPGTLQIHGWGGHREMLVESTLRNHGAASVEAVRARVDELLKTYAKRFDAGGEPCLFWEKPLTGAWREHWGGAEVNTLHNGDAWQVARTLVQLYRYDKARGIDRPDYLEAIDRLYNWSRQFVWTRNEFADVPSSPFAIGCTLVCSFLLDYQQTFKRDPVRADKAKAALALADRLVWRYLPIWAMDSDRFDAGLDPSFLAEPNSGRDWAGLACANEVFWVVDTLLQVYVHTGDERMRYYLRGIMARWPQLYLPVAAESLADCTQKDMTEGLGLSPGSGPGQGGRYPFGWHDFMAMAEPVGDSLVRVVAGDAAAMAFGRRGARPELGNYFATGGGCCGFEVRSPLGGEFDLCLTYPNADISTLEVRLDNGATEFVLGNDRVRRPKQAPSSLYIRRVTSGDQLTVGPPVKRDWIILAGNSWPPLPTEPPAGPLRPQLWPLTAPRRLSADWSNPEAFAGLDVGLRWTCGVPHWQGWSAGSADCEAGHLPDTRGLAVTYSPPLGAGLDVRPLVRLDDGSALELSGRPVLAWRAWPPLFQRWILMDQVDLPAGRQAKSIEPRGTLLCGHTLAVGETILGDPRRRAAWELAATQLAQLAAQRALLARLKAKFAALPPVPLAIVPPADGAPAEQLLRAAGLNQRFVKLTETQLVDPRQFNAQRYPFACYFGQESYHKTVKTPGDGVDALQRYLRGGGTLLLLASEPFPLFYALTAGSQAKPVESLLPRWGLTIGGWETAPPGLSLSAPDRAVTPSVNATFPWPTGDQRLRWVVRDQLDPADVYRPLVVVHDAAGHALGDAAGYVEFKHGPAQGGRLVYVWCSLAPAPEGTALVTDVLWWLLSRGGQP